MVYRYVSKIQVEQIILKRNFESLDPFDLAPSASFMNDEILIIIYIACRGHFVKIDPYTRRRSI